MTEGTDRRMWKSPCFGDTMLVDVVADAETRSGFGDQGEAVVAFVLGAAVERGFDVEPVMGDDDGPIGWRFRFYGAWEAATWARAFREAADALQAMGVWETGFTDEEVAEHERMLASLPHDDRVAQDAWVKEDRARFDALASRVRAEADVRP
jgi:hypothetical protein